MRRCEKFLVGDSRTVVRFYYPFCLTTKLLGRRFHWFENARPSLYETQYRVARGIEMNFRVVSALILLSALALCAEAQSVPSQTTRVAVVNAPFTAEEWTTSTSISPSGVTRSVTHRTDIARNSAGSTRRENRVFTSSATEPSSTSSVEIQNIPNSLVIREVPGAKAAMLRPLGPDIALVVPFAGIRSEAAPNGAPRDQRPDAQEHRPVRSGVGGGRGIQPPHRGVRRRVTCPNRSTC